MTRQLDVIDELLARVHALARRDSGGAETIVEDRTGVLLDAWDEDSVASALATTDWDGMRATDGVSNALRFAPDEFLRRKR